MKMIISICIFITSWIYILLLYLENNRLKKNIRSLERRLAERDARCEAAEKYNFIVKNRCDELENTLKQRDSELERMTEERKRLWDGNVALSGVLKKYMKDDDEYDEFYETEAS